MKIKLLTLYILLLSISGLNAYDMYVKGQASGYTMLSDHPTTTNQLGIHYIPTLMFSDFFKKFPLDFETSVFSNIIMMKDKDDEFNFELYRYILRYTTQQGEFRFGLQKINFGPAQLLRTLQWFDTINVLDPTNFSDGVKAGLMRYYFPNNANVWLWIHNPDKRILYYGTPVEVDSKTGLGGRFQYPLGNSELALTVHSVDNGINGMDFRETRFAFDIRTEKIVGIWTEAMGTYNDNSSAVIPEWMQSYTIGVDFTFGIGNGLYSVLEYMYSRNSGNNGTENQNVAAMLSYPVGIFDAVQGFYAYDKNMEIHSWYVAWQRVYDSIILNVNTSLMKDVSENYTKSVQCMIIFNH